MTLCRFWVRSRLHKTWIQKSCKYSIEGYKIKFVPLLLNLNIIIMYSSEDLEIKCKSNTNKLACKVL